MSRSSAYQYRVGGHLPIDAPSYVVRAADQQFHAGLKAGELCYVLNSRQMGKSSLRFRTMHLLQQDGMACVAIDLQGIGSHNITPQQWYAGLVKRLIQGLHLTPQIDLRSWWQEREMISPVQRFSEFVEVVLPKFMDQQITIFIDEIDSTLSLDFDTDDFFAAVRACSEFPHINFALLGVATPADLIKDGRRSPFNIGQAIELRGFQADEVQPLIYGLQEQAMRPEVVMAAILDWTGGQPFLTQKLCRLIQELDTPLPSNYEAEFVASLVQSQIITNWETQDEPEHLKTIRNYLLRSGQQNTYQTLSVYQDILQHGFVCTDHSVSQTDLRLSGLVVKRNEQLAISNAIYAQIFNQQWLDRSLMNCRPYGSALAAWLVNSPQHLLRGKALQEAQAWAKGKTLLAQDQEFLHMSRSIERKVQRKKLLWKIAVWVISLLVLASVIQLVRLMFWRVDLDGKNTATSKSTPAIASSPATSASAIISNISGAIDPKWPHAKQTRILLNSSKLRRQTQDYPGSLIDAVKAGQQFQQISNSNAQEKLRTPILKNIRESLHQLRLSTGNQHNNDHLQTKDLPVLLQESCQELKKSTAISSEVSKICADN
jgi:AAA-like domain